MKNLKYIALSIFSLVLLFGCETDEETVAKVADVRNLQVPF